VLLENTLPFGPVLVIGLAAGLVTASNLPTNREGSWQFRDRRCRAMLSP